MLKDRGALPRVAWLVALMACGPSFKPPEPPADPGPIGKLEHPRPLTKNGRQLVVGELCPRAAAGRPAVAPLIMRTVQWTDNTAELANAVERGSTPRFVVFDVDGKRAGMFETVGLADIGLAQSVASGTYAGASPCSSDGGKGQRVEAPACAAATAGCGLAVAALTRPDDPPETPVFAVGGACISGDALAVDIDNDGVSESFPLGSLLDGIRSPSSEWSASPTAGAACAPHFELYDQRLAASSEGGKPGDAKSTVTMDVIGVIDLDGDGRNEVVLALKFATVRTIVIYSAPASPQRLELVGEGVSFPR